MGSEEGKICEERRSQSPPVTAYALTLACMNSSRSICLWATVIALSCPRASFSQPAAKTYPFFPFCIDWQDSRKRSFEEQAALLKELGYEGVGHIWLDKVAER